MSYSFKVEPIEKPIVNLKNNGFLSRSGQKKQKRSGFDEILKKEQEKNERKIEVGVDSNCVSGCCICDLWISIQSRNKRHLDSTEPS